MSGPLQNIGDNAVLIAKSIECSAKLTIEQANETTQATISALNDQMESIARATRSINENSRRVEEFADREMVKVFEKEDKAGHLSPDKMLKRASRQCHLNSGLYNCLVLLWPLSFGYLKKNKHEKSNLKFHLKFH